jgi:hypothetical protein
MILRPFDFLIPCSSQQNPTRPRLRNSLRRLRRIRNEYRLNFPIEATASLPKKGSGHESKRVMVVGLSGKLEQFLGKYFHLQIVLGDYWVAGKYYQLSASDARGGTMDIFHIWNYWARGGVGISTPTASPASDTPSSDPPARRGQYLLRRKRGPTSARSSGQLRET